MSVVPLCPTDLDLMAFYIVLREHDDHAKANHYYALALAQLICTVAADTDRERAHKEALAISRDLWRRIKQLNVGPLYGIRST